MIFSAIDRKITIMLVTLAILVFIIGSLLLLQSIFGRYEGSEWGAWAWFLIHVIPVNLVLNYTFLKNRVLTVNVASKNQLLFQFIFYGSIIYMAMLLGVLLVQPFLGAENAPVNNLRAADTGLIILQVILIGITVFMVYKSRLFKHEHQSVIKEEDEEFAVNKVFVSYNHVNSPVARELAELLSKEGIDVIIDYEDMQAGENIQSFIEDCVKKSYVTLSIISKESLLSGWVASETINTFFLEKFSKNKRFIACYLDESFMDRKFAGEAAATINKKLEALTMQLDENDKLGIDTRDINPEISRLRTLKANIDLILERLRGSLCVDIRDKNLQKNFPMILKSIQKA